MGLCQASPTPLRLDSYEDGWPDLHAEPAPFLSPLLVSEEVQKEALPVLYVKKKAQLSLDLSYRFST